MKNRRILGKDIFVSNETRQTGLNNNDLIVGVSGSGKTGGYVIPNIAQCNESMIVADTKGLLYKRFYAKLRKAGYEVLLIDFKDFENSCSYNPLDYIRPGMKPGSWCEQDIITIAEVLVPAFDKREPFWEMSARMVVACLIAFVKEALPKREQNLCSVCRLTRVLGTREGAMIFSELQAALPDSIAVRRYKDLMKVKDADKTWACIQQFVSVALELFGMEEADNMFAGGSEFRIAELGERKTAVFVNVSDTDRAFDRIINVFYTQVLHELCNVADKTKEGRLKVPVRFILDDFATNAYIPDFDKIISVIRSREIAVSLILQSISQLETLYTPAQAQTIINGCDHLLYLGGQDVQTANFIGTKANKTADTILSMKLDDAYLFSRGERPKMIEKVPPYQYQILAEHREKPEGIKKPKGEEVMLAG